ncbi:LysR family transcriptional regulator [Teichococcus aestuarii]|uniref:LysR family transcriptional regulator n=1 Tax=Teichococcus aestuarii TaxID=568898 RepID=A0A2U1V412_9PROT|nr:LysR family transcriptional regulator [Pseudoroseomonas aestuarii]PWC28659.1 LysR family transcriptional regulator [Pseudoroseomonas aestuarii]
MLKISALEALRAFVECGSVSQAAARLGRTQPQVGRLLAGLEQSLGFALFTRERQRLSLTPEGRRFYQQAERVLAGHDGLAQLAGQIRGGQRDSHLRILTAPQMANALLGEALAEMARRAPDFTASIDTRVRLDAEAVVGQEHFDLGVTVPPLQHPGLRVEPLCEVEAVVVMRRDHPLAARRQVELPALVEHDLIATHARSLLRQRLEQHCRQAGLMPRYRFEAANGVVVCQMAAQGLGLALADPFVALSAAAPQLVMRRFRPAVPLPYGLFYPAWQARSETAQVFAGLVSEVAQRQAEQLMRRLRRG